MLEGDDVVGSTLRDASAAGGSAAGLAQPLTATSIAAASRKGMPFLMVGTLGKGKNVRPVDPGQNHGVVLPTRASSVAIVSLSVYSR